MAGGLLASLVVYPFHYTVCAMYENRPFARHWVPCVLGIYTHLGRRTRERKRKGQIEIEKKMMETRRSHVVGSHRRRRIQRGNGSAGKNWEKKTRSYLNDVLFSIAYRNVYSESEQGNEQKEKGHVQSVCVQYGQHQEEGGGGGGGSKKNSFRLKDGYIYQRVRVCVAYRAQYMAARAADTTCAYQRIFLDHRGEKKKKFFLNFFFSLQIFLKLF